MFAAVSIEGLVPRTTLWGRSRGVTKAVRRCTGSSRSSPPAPRAPGPSARSHIEAREKTDNRRGMRETLSHAAWWEPAPQKNAGTLL